MADDILLPEDQDLDNTEDTVETDGETDLIEALKSLADSEDDDDSEDDSEYEDETEDDDDDDIEDEEYEDDSEDDDEETDEEKGAKREQSREENARFAAERRQRELDRKVQAELDRLKQESPEFALSKQLSEMYGIPAEQLIEQMKTAKLEEEAKKLNVPLKMLQDREEERTRLQQVEAELNQLRFERWENRIQSEATTLKNDFKMLTDEDIDSSIQYLLKEVGNVDMPLEQAVYALHGKKIIENLAKEKAQDKLATDSGRKRKTPPSPKNGKASQTKSVTAEEKYIAEQLGMSVDDYLKYK